MGYLLNETLKNYQKKAPTAWTPVDNTYYHFLTFDLGAVKIINKIATLGHKHRPEYVTEFVIQYSDDGELWRSYVSPGGEVQVTNFNKFNFFVCFLSLLLLNLCYALIDMQNVCAMRVCLMFCAFFLKK